MRSKSPEKARKIIDFINGYFDEYRCSPSLRDIENGTGISRQTALRYINEMKDEGLLEYDGKNGVITKHIDHLTDSASRNLHLPIIGRIACGDPTSEESENEGFVDFPVSLLSGNDYFVLRAYHDSMIDAGIDDGDLVIVRHTNTARRGDIVVALDENGQNTLKRLMYDSRRERYYLHPENENYDDIYTDEISIQGVAEKVIKSL